jgi:hypothetical protein
MTPISPITGSSITATVFSLAAGRHRREGAAVERAVGGDDLEGAISILCAPLSGDLDRRLICLSARVAEEHARWERELDQPPGQLGLRLGEIQVRCMDQLARLCADGRGHLWMCMAKEIHGDAGHQVEVRLARVVVEQAALAADECDRQAPASLHQIFVGEVLRGHRPGQRVTIVPMPASVKSSSRRA